MPYPPHPKNAPGPFYVENDCCMACDAPFHEAPDLMGTDDGQGGYHCHFRKQPTTPDEVERAVRACAVSCVEAVRYAGSDPAILKRFQEWGGIHSSDVLSKPPQAVRYAGNDPAILQGFQELGRIHSCDVLSKPPSESQGPSSLVQCCQGFVIGCGLPNPDEHSNIIPPAPNPDDARPNLPDHP